MKLWLIERTDDANGYDTYYGFVVRAKTPEDAFRLACERTWMEGAEWTSEDFRKYATIATSPFDVEELTPNGEPSVILVDHVLG